MRRLVLLALLACNSYDPDLGDTPFLCGTDEPRCPDGYTPVDVSVVRCVCQRSVQVPDAGPAYTCNVDLNEPNDGFKNATPTLVGTNAAQNFPNAAICGAGDRDDYQMMLPRSGVLISVEVTFDTTRKPPTVDILNNVGGSLAPDVSSPQGGRIVATKTAPSVGSYYAEISGSQDVNYSVRLSVTQ